MRRVQDILAFWFGTIGDDGVPIENHAKLWFRVHAETDKFIRDNFEADLRQAAQGKLTEWEQHPAGRLALLVLLDQFSRNIYRGTAQAFAQDELALSLCLVGIDKGHDVALRPIERVFFYLPLEHAENLEMQDKCVRLFETLIESLPQSTAQKLHAFLDHARGHRGIIRRFGRFPHRNKLLGRASTPAEREFLTQGGATFGQQ